MNLVRRLLHRLVERLPPPRVLSNREGTSPYLSRYYLTAAPYMADGSSPWTPGGGSRDGIIWPQRVWGLYLHRFHRGDDDPQLHNHPWRWAVSLILAGGYREERRVGDRVEARLVKPWRLNLIRSGDFHRVDLVEGDAWSLFLAGPKFSNWGFWDRLTDEFLPCREFIRRRRGGWS